MVAPFAGEHRPPLRSADLRIAALRRFAVAITVLNVAGHAYLGFEQSWQQLAIAVFSAYAAELALECVRSLGEARSPAFLEELHGQHPVIRLVDFLLPAHITGMAVSMLLYAGARDDVFVFAAVTAIASKRLFRLPASVGRRHFFNPSNLGIACTLMAFPTVGIAPPYQFTEQLGPVGDWVLPAIIVMAGSYLNARLTRRLLVSAGWCAGFVLQSVVRALCTSCSLPGALSPMTGLAFLLFNFYMITDPATTPQRPGAQVLFGLSVAAVYGVLVSMHVVFGFFFALALVCLARGLFLWAAHLHRSWTHAGGGTP